MKRRQGDIDYRAINECHARRQNGGRQDPGLRFRPTWRRRLPGENDTFITWLPHSRSTSPNPPNLTITETIHEVVVYHSDGLHVGINDRRTNETESPKLKVLAERLGFV